MSRVDPLTIAVYPGGKNPSELDNSRSVSAKAAECGLVQGSGGYFPGAVDLDCFKFPEDRPDQIESVDSSRREMTTEKGNGDTRSPPASRTGQLVVAPCPALSGKLAYTRAVGCKRERNRLTALLIKQSDDVCVREMGSLTADQATINASLNILSTAATATANIVTGDQAKSILAGVGTLATAGRSHINADVYRNTVSYAVSRAISLERKRLRDLIEARYTQEADIFTIDDAIRAANEYHGVCSFYRGLELVLASVEGDQRTRDMQARREQIDDLERRITGYRALLATKTTGEDAAIYTNKIGALVDQIQALSLAGIPADSQPPQGSAGTGSGQSDQSPPVAPPSENKK